MIGQNRRTWLVVIYQTSFRVFTSAWLNPLIKSIAKALIPISISLVHAHREHRQWQTAREAPKVFHGSINTCACGPEKISP